MTYPPQHERNLVYCPWGCGQPIAQHAAAIVCPPQNSEGHWINSPTKALGATPQLQDDIKSLLGLKKEADCSTCRVAIQRRINVIENELKRRTGGIR